MQNLNNLPYISEVRALASERKEEIYLVGGPVRDILLGRPVADMDLCVEGDGIAFGKSLAQVLGGRFNSYKRFLTGKLRLPRGQSIDIATARKERYAFSGAMPDVSPTSIGEDLFRRDFTVNAMAISLKDGSLVDPHEGEKDLTNKILRILHPKSFEDDPTRALRGIRFQIRSGFSFERETEKLLLRSLKEKWLLRVSKPRLRDEFWAILKEEKWQKILQQLAREGVLKSLGLPEDVPERQATTAPERLLDYLSGLSRDARRDLLRDFAFPKALLDT